MIRYEINYHGLPVQVSLDVEDQHSSAAIVVESEPPVIADTIKQNLQDTYGAFGHQLGEETTAIDLDTAINSLGFPVEAVEGTELVAEYENPAPEGAAT
ncbi:MAG: hypothetical protein AAGF24_05390 [Cyanobacteria bacterium P01_H01_bin.121]